MRNEAFRRKIMYLIAIALLLIPISAISRPPIRQRDGSVTGGGKLSQLRREHGLSQAELGEIDPASESMKLATLGFRGVAANFLWQKANEDKMKERWDRFKVTLDQISKLQPNFIKVWEFQAWNLSYNISVEFDDYRQRYHWVKKGMEFLLEGIRHNRDEARLLGTMGWFAGNKIGRADEYVQFRRLFRDDDDFHLILMGDKDQARGYMVDKDQARGPDGKPDNWLVSRLWHEQAQVAARRRPLRGQSPLIFHSKPAMSLIYHSIAIEEEGYLDEKARFAWKRAGDLWNVFGARDIPTSAGFDIRLNEGEVWQERVEQLVKELEQVSGVTRQQITEEKRAALSADERAAMDLPFDQRSDDQKTLAYAANERLTVTNDEVGNRAPRDRRGEVKRLLARLAQAEEESIFTRRYRDIVNFVYWRTRCEVEQSQVAINARRLVYDADRARRSANLEVARQNYDQAWTEWAKIFTDYPSLKDDTTAQELVEGPIKRYRTLLGQLDEAFPPEGFPLIELVKMHDREYRRQLENAAQPNANEGEASESPPSGS